MRFVSAPVLAAAAFFGLAATAEARVRIQVDLSSQTMHVESSQGEFDWPVSTGREGFRTPTGSYRSQRLFEMTYSAKYDNAPMPHAIFFTGGYAIHATYATGALGRPASHGCVRLSPRNAAILFNLVKREGASIAITGTAPGSDELVASRERPRRAAARVAARPRHYDRPRYYEEDEMFSYAPVRRHHARPLRDWVNMPLENW